VDLPDTAGKVACGLAWIFVPGKDEHHVDMAELYLHTPAEEGDAPFFLCAIPAAIIRGDLDLPTKITKLIAVAIGGSQFLESKPQTDPKKGD
jgi:hypothetical protein